MYPSQEWYWYNKQNAVKKTLKDYDLNIPVIFNMNFGNWKHEFISIAIKPDQGFAFFGLYLFLLLLFLFL